MRRSRDLFVKALHQPRLADACLADDQRYLPFTTQRALPPVRQQAQLVLASDKWRQPPQCCCRFEPPTRTARLDYPVELERLFDAFERSRAKVFHHEHSRHQPMGRRGDYHRAGVGRRFHSRRDIRRIAEDIDCAAGAFAHHHRPRVDADSRRELRPCPLISRLRYSAELCEGLDNRQPSARRPLGVVIVRLRPAE